MRWTHQRSRTKGRGETKRHDLPPLPVPSGRDLGRSQDYGPKGVPQHDRDRRVKTDSNFFLQVETEDSGDYEIREDELPTERRLENGEVPESQE